MEGLKKNLIDNYNIVSRTITVLKFNQLHRSNIMSDSHKKFRKGEVWGGGGGGVIKVKEGSSILLMITASTILKTPHK